MALHGTKDEAYTISIDAGVTGLTDIEVTVTKPDGTDEAANLTTTEVGTKGIYEAVYTPAVVGAFYLSIVSPTEAGLDGKVSRFVVVEHDDDDIIAAISGIDTKVTAIKAVVDELDTESTIGFID